MPVDAHLQDSILVATLTQPEVLNAWTGAMQRELTDIVRSASEDAKVTGFVLTGSGDAAFCAGQDLREFATLAAGDSSAWLDNFYHLYEAILSCPKPTVAALNGVAAGSGFQVAQLCDLRIAHAGVRMGQPEVSSGIPSITGLYLALQNLGHARTVDLMLTGRMMMAEEAYAIGLVNEIVDRSEVLPTACAWVERLARQPTTSFRLTKRRIRDTIWPGLQEAFRAAEAIDAEAFETGSPQSTASDFVTGRATASATEQG